MLCGPAQNVAVGGVEFDGVAAVEEATVEPGDDVRSEVAAVVTHGLKELRQLLVEHGAGLAAGFDQLAEDVVGDETDGIGEETEDDADEEVRDLFLGVRGGRSSAFEFELLGKLEEVGGGVSGDALGGLSTGIPGQPMRSLHERT